MDQAAHADAAVVGHALNPGAQIDDIAHEIVALDDHFAPVNAKAELHRRLWGCPQVTVMEGFLTLNRKFDAIDRVRKFGQNAVAGASKDTAAITGNHRIND